MKSFDEWKEANLDEQAAAPTAMGKLEKAKLTGTPASLLAKFLGSLGGVALFSDRRKLSVLAQVAEALGVSQQEMGKMGTKVKGAITKDAAAPAAAPPAE